MKTVIVNLKDIKDNNYILSPKYYIKKEVNCMSNKTNYEKIINDCYYKEQKSIAYLHNYIGELKTDRRINMNRWWELHCHILNLEDY